MILGIGTDLVEVDRIARMVNEVDGFKEKVFSPTEIAYCESGKNKFERYAARFAAKEAFAKALGTGIFGYIPMSAVEIIHGANQKPMLQIVHPYDEKFHQEHAVMIHLSMSHTADLATAMVILEKR
jgi:holo-[acyl-carrier protein] synthase